MATADGLDQIRSFLLVAEELSFRKAAERLHIDQSALTRRIQRLEHLLGFALFERSTREVSMTPAGIAFYQENSKLLEDYGKSVANARRIAKGQSANLRIAYMAFAAVALMPAAIAEYRRRYPHVEISLVYERTQGQKLALANGEIDLGYMLGPFQHSEFETVRVANEPLYAVLPREHPLSHLNEVRPGDLAPYPFIMGDMREWEFFRWRMQELFASAGVSIQVAIETSNALAIVGLVNVSLGITICPESLLGIGLTGLEARPIADPSFRSETMIAWRRDSKSVPLQQFVEIATQLA